MRGLPLAFPGMTVGLLGGSFDPAHEGHLHAALVARRRLGLAKVWWLASPQNPLKPRSSPLEARLASARAAARGPAMVVTDIESRLGLRFTHDTLVALRRRYRGVRFVLIVGGDNLAQLHRWRAWRAIAGLVSLCVVSRPSGGVRALCSPFASRFRASRLPAGRESALPHTRPPAWIHLAARHVPVSSSALRAAGRGLA
jgi:nicotinate-nucleotide adenylyltransferase